MSLRMCIIWKGSGGRRKVGRLWESCMSMLVRGNMWLVCLGGMRGIWWFGIILALCIGVLGVVLRGGFGEVSSSTRFVGVFMKMLMIIVGIDMRRATVHDGSSQAWGLNEKSNARMGFP